MLHRMPHIEIADENIKQIQLAYQQTNRIMSAIESQEVSLKSQRDDIERRLQIETKAFQEELNDVKQQVEKFKENNNRKREDEYNKMINKINTTLQGLSERLKKINAQEMDLELTATECPAIEDCQKKIKPFQELWELVGDWSKCKQSWETSVLKTLNPDEVEKEHKRMRVAVMRLVHQFETAKL